MKAEHAPRSNLQPTRHSPTPHVMEMIAEAKAIKKLDMQRGGQIGPRGGGRPSVLIFFHCPVPLYSHRVTTASGMTSTINAASSDRAPKRKGVGKVRRIGPRAAIGGSSGTRES